MGVDSKNVRASNENENVGSGGVAAISKRRSSSAGLQSKSLIPVPVASPTSSKDNENEGAAPVEQKTRRPLGSIQNVGTPRRLSSLKEKAPVVASPKVVAAETKSSKKRVSISTGTTTAEAGTLTKAIGGSRRLSTGVPNTPHNSPSKLKGKKKSVGQENKQETVGEGSIAYWKELAESRRQALEDALAENMELHERVEELKKENEQLEELVEEAKQLADMVNSVAEDVSLDESGIGDTINVIKMD